MADRRIYVYPCGTRSNYTSGGCRCPACRRANADYMVKRRAELRSTHHPPHHVHGTPCGPTYYGCRCGDCRAVANAAKRAANATSRSTA